jgi:NitT/TauT family transport system substrate-binding protein
VIEIMHLAPARIGAVALLSCATLACTGTPASQAPAASNATQTSVALRVPFTPGFATIPVHAALVNGYFKQNGLDVTLTEGLDLPTYIAALDKQFDIAMTTPSIFLGAVAQGVPVKAVSGVQLTVVDPPTNPLIVKDPSITSIKDLAGKTVGAPTLTGVSAASLQYVLKKNGLDPASVKLVMVPFPEQADQLEAGRVDGVLSTPPFYVPLLNKGYKNVVDTPAEAVRLATGDSKTQAVNAFFVASDAFVSSKPQAYQAFRKSIQQGIDWMKANEKDARAMAQSWLQVPAEVANTSPMAVDAAEITAEQIAPWITVLQESGAVQGQLPDAKQLVAP